MHIELIAWNTRKTLLLGDFISLKHAIEHAINNHIKLDYLEISNADLRNGNFDGGSFNYAKFTRVNFEGANLSEGSFIKAQFETCNLTNVTLTDASCVGAQFKDTAMTNCEALYTDFRGALFGCHHFLKSDFRQSSHFGGAAFMNKGNLCPMPKGPVFIRGMGMDVVLLDEHAIIGGMVILRKEQLFDTHGKISSIFAGHGLSPSQDAIQKLRLCVRSDGKKLHKVA